MGYEIDDLRMLVGIRDKALLKGTTYFELHPGELPQPFACWLDGSLFVKDAAFDFSVACFERANPNFDYFAFQPFERDQIDVLVRELSMFTSELVPGCSRDVVFSRYNSIFKPSIWDGVATEPLRAAVMCAIDEMTSFIEGSRRTAERLWVLGM